MTPRATVPEQCVRDAEVPRRALPSVSPALRASAVVVHRRAKRRPRASPFVTSTGTGDQGFYRKKRSRRIHVVWKRLDANGLSEEIISHKRRRLVLSDEAPSILPNLSAQWKPIWDLTPAEAPALLHVAS